MTMNDFYTRKQAMERLGIKSAHAFNRLAKKYPEGFVVLVQSKYKLPRYDKAALDKFAKMRDSLR